MTLGGMPDRVVVYWLTTGPNDVSGPDVTRTSRSVPRPNPFTRWRVGPTCPPGRETTENVMGMRFLEMNAGDGDRADTQVRPSQTFCVARNGTPVPWDGIAAKRPDHGGSGNLGQTLKARGSAMAMVTHERVESGAGVDLVDHVGIVVRGIAASLPLYVETLGFRAFADEVLPEVGVRVVYLTGGPPGSTTLQLIEPTRAGPLRDFLETEGDGLHHICLAVADLPEALARLAPGVDVRIVMGGRGRRACFLPERRAGLRIELTEIEPWETRRGAGEPPAEEDEA